MYEIQPIEAASVGQFYNFARGGGNAGKTVAGIDVQDHEVEIPMHWRVKSGAAFGGEILRLRFSGNLSGPRVVVLGGVSGSRFVGDDGEGERAWWRGMVFAGGAIDLNHYCVVGFDYPFEAPVSDIDLSPEDFADLLAFGLERTGVHSLHGFIGASFGGMIGLTFARKYTDILDRLCVVSAAHRPNVMAQARRIVQRRIIEFAVEAGEPEKGVALARQLAMTTYRTATEFEERFSANLDSPDNVGCYLEARGYDCAEIMSASRYLTLSAAIDRHQEELEHITTPTHVIGVNSDELTPIGDSKELYNRLGGPSKFTAISSRYGHDAFLKETEVLGKHLKKFLNEGFS